MKCTFIPEAGMILCGSRQRRKRCSCGELADLECDWPIRRFESHDVEPKRTSARVHLKQWRIYYVHDVHTGEKLVRVAEKPPSFTPYRGKLTECTWAEWYTKTAPTCDRPVCRRCVARWGKLEFCAAHGRELAKRKNPSER